MNARPGGPLLRLFSPQFLRFLSGSAAGLTIDLVGFTLLVLAGVEPGIANLCSSFASISVVYVLVTRFAFGARAGAPSYALFVAWYSASILLFSTLIELAATWSGASPLIWKAASVPLSFGLNFLFSRWLFGRGTRRAARSGALPVMPGVVDDAV